MKKTTDFMVATLLSLVVPTIFVGTIVFALQQSFGVGLVILLGALIVNTIMGIKLTIFPFRDEGDYQNELPEYFDNAHKRSVAFKVSRISEVFLNLTNVALFLAPLLLVMKNFALNPFGGLGFAISGAVLIIIIMYVAFFSEAKIAGKLRKIAISTILISLFILLYLTFSSQMIWIPVSLLWIFILGFTEEVDRVGHRLFVFLFMPVMLAILSTLIQFWASIANGIWSLWIIVFSLGRGFPVVLIIVLVAIFIWYKIKKNNIRKIEEQRSKEREENEKIQIASRDREEFNKILDSIFSKGKIEKEELILVSRRWSSALLEGRESSFIKIVTNFPIGEFITVSRLKSQIVWDPSLGDVLNLHNWLYGRTYEDESLNLILQSIYKIGSKIYEVQHFKGYRELENFMKSRLQSIPTKKWIEEDMDRGK